MILCLLLKLLRGIKIIDETSEQINLWQAEERVEHVDARLVKIKKLVWIVLVHFVRVEELEAVHAHEYVAVVVHLEQIAVQLVVPKAAHRKRRIVDKVFDFLRVAELQQLIDNQIKRQYLVLGRLVQRQCVIHVEAKKLYLTQLKRPIHKHTLN